MIKRIFTLVISVLLSAGLWAQTAFEQIAADPLKAGGIYNMYPESGFSKPVDPPKGYKPFYISHYGRHGARFNSSNSGYKKILTIFSKAHDDGALTEKGEDFYRRYAAQFPYCENRGGDLTEKGAQQHRGIARRMFRNYPEVFRGAAHIDARSTVVPRCVLSMDAFCDELKILNPALEIDRSASSSDMGFLNPHSIYNPDVRETDEGYNNKSAYWQPSYKKMLRENTDPDVFFARLFKDPNYVRKFGSATDFEVTLYYLACSNQCLDYEESYWDLFTFDEKCLLWEADSYRFFCSKGPDDIQGGRQWAFCKTFAENVIDRAEEDIASGKVSARLRFGHDITIMSFMTLMNIDGWSTPAPSPHDAKDLWQDYNVPMAANLQFVFYRNSSGDILVRMMNNEKDFLLPIPSRTAPYYSWDDFRSYFRERIALAENIISTTVAPPKKK